MEQYLQYVFWVLAAFFNAVMDAVENENYFESGFKNLPRQFWYKRDSWKYAARILGWKADAWHISKSLMVVCVISTLIFYVPVVRPWLHFIIMGVAWNLCFTFFYHVVFRVK